MTDDRHGDAPGDGEGGLPTAREIRRRWPGLVWAIPLAAAIIVAYLGIRALSRHGVEAVVTFGYAEGVTPGDTKVLENGVEVGRVKKVRVSKDGKHVDVTLSLDPRAKKSLNTATTFWLIGENPTITDIQSIRAAVAGVIIAMAPGTGGTDTREFKGLDSPPIIPPGAKGTPFFLTAAKLGSIQQGASINYRGMAIGKVVQTRLVAPDSFRIEAFVNRPYDAMVGRDAQFWTGSPLKFSLSGASLSAGLSSPASVLQGAIEFDRPDHPQGARAPAGTVFPLYDDRAAAREGSSGPEIGYALSIRGPAGDLEVGSAVRMLGYTIGRVTSAQLIVPPGGAPFTAARVVLFPHRLDVALPDGAAIGDWRTATDAAVERLLARGYRAKLVQSPPFVGAHVVTFDAVSGAGAARLVRRGDGDPAIPLSEGGAGTDELLARATSIMAKVDRIPIERIGRNVEALTATLGSRDVRESVAHLNATLASVEKIASAAQPQIGPLIVELRKTSEELHATAAAARMTLSGEGAAQDRSLPDAIQQLDGAARSIRSLTDYLGRHPEALIRGKAKEKK